MLIPPELKKLIDSVDFVSFDIFDTLILRNVYHFNDVFLFVAEEVRRRYGIDIPRFTELHTGSERRAREIQEKLDGTREINLDRLYEVMIQYEGINAGSAEILKKIELEYERRFCTVNPFMQRIYEYCRSRNKRIGIVSDMYLPQPFLEGVLSDAGYDGYEFFLLSNSCRKRKRDGSIFPLLIQKAGVQAERILHIGDDRTSDFERPREYGLKAWFYLRCKEADRAESARLSDPPRVARRDTPALALYNGLRIKRFFAERPLDCAAMDEDFWYRLGYGKLGFVFLAFVYWLIEKLRQDNFERVYFLARDGYFVKQVYDLIRERQDLSLPPATYLYASRRALALAALDARDENRLALFCMDSERLPLSSYLRRLNLNPADYSDRIISAGFSGPDHVVVPGRDDERLKKLLTSFSAESAAIAAGQKNLLLRYLKQVGLRDCKKAALVDIGWQGSMQKSLADILAEENLKVSLKGFYFGTFAEARRIGHDENTLCGWLCDFSYPQHIRKTLLRSVPLLEFFHSAPHGSVYAYESTPDGVGPLFARNTIRKQLDQAAEMQRGALDFIKDWLDAAEGIDWLKPTRDEAFSVLADILKSPDRLELRRLGDLKHVDSFDGAGEARCLARPPNWPGLMNLKRLRREYLKSHWKNAFVARLLNESIYMPAMLRRIIKSWSR